MDSDGQAGRQPPKRQARSHEKTFNSKDLLGLSVEEFMNAPPPSEVYWGRSTLQYDAKLAERVFQAIDTFIMSTEFDEFRGSSYGFDSTFLHLFKYYDHLARRILWAYVDDQIEAVADLVQFTFGHPPIEKYVARYERLKSLADEFGGVQQSRAFALVMWMPFIEVLTLASPLYLWPGRLTVGVAKRIRAELLNQMRFFYESSFYARTDEQRASAYLLIDGAFDTAIRALREESGGTAEDQVFDRLAVEDLPALARRDASRIGHYAASIEHAFEDQLELLFRSFGFSVMRAEPGEPRVDLLCVSQTRRAYSFLVEAKSSKRPYSLPVDDRRALVQYVEDFRSSRMERFAGLEFILLVIGQAAKVLDTRLSGLSVQLGLPCYYVLAEDLTELRQRVSGPVDHEKFRSAVKTREIAVSSAAIDALISDTRGFEQLLTPLSLLSYRGLRK